MNSTFLRILAVILALGAFTTAWLGYRISTKTPAAPIKVVVPTYSQVVAAQTIPVGKIITADDVEIISTPQPDSRGYNNVHDVLGKLTMEPVVKGTPLISKHFPSMGLLAQSLAPDQRAIAVKVNEVIGVGGFVKPGDRVDVLLYLRADRETDNVSSAQIVLNDVEVLAYGDVMGEEVVAEKEPGDKPKVADADISNNIKKQDTKKEKDSRSAILAVPEGHVSRLMLAESSGVLRLALRGAQPLNAASSETNQFLRLDDVAKPTASQVALKETVPVDRKISPVKKKNYGSTVGTRERVIVHRGEQVEVVNVTK